MSTFFYKKLFFPIHFCQNQFTITRAFLLMAVILYGVFMPHYYASALMDSSDDLINASSRRLSPIVVCDMKIRDAGIPIDGISGWPVKRIDFKSEATEQQKQKAWEIVNNFDYEKELMSISKSNNVKIGHGLSVPLLTKDGEIAVAQINGYSYLYFQSNGVTYRIPGRGVFESLASKSIGSILGSNVEVDGFNEYLPGGIIEGVGTDSIIGIIKNVMISFGINIKNGITTIVNLATEKLFAKTARIERLEMVDKATGDIYCTWVENGEWHKVKGECAPLFNNNSQTFLDIETNQPSTDESVLAPAVDTVPNPDGSGSLENAPTEPEESLPSDQTSPEQIQLPVQESDQPEETQPPAPEADQPEDVQLPTQEAEQPEQVESSMPVSDQPMDQIIVSPDVLPIN